MQIPSGPALAKTALFIALGGLGVFYASVFVRAILRKRRESPGDAVPTPAGLATGFVTNFFDTLGIGSYAPTTAIFRFLRMVPDEQIPGTLTVGHTLPVIAQAFLFTTAVPVDVTTLVLMIIAAVLGAWLGAGVVSRMPRRAIQLGMGVCLMGFAVLMTYLALRGNPVGGEAVGVTGVRLGIAVAGNFALGALMTLGIGMYAPCMILVSLLGMNVRAAFPIMMGSCAILMPVASARFARKGRFNVRAALGLALAGLPAVFIAFYIVKTLPLTVLRWVVIGVVAYTALALLHAARRERLTVPQPVAEPAGD
jgi:uncharacterized membrane protein YfcA